MSASARARATTTVSEAIAIGQEALAGGPQLEGEAGIDDVAARQAQVEVATLRPDRFRDLRHERDDVVVGRALDLGDPVDIDLRAGLEGVERGRGDHAARRLRAGDRELDPEHLLEPGGLRPDGAHLGEGVAADHVTAPRSSASAPISWRRWRPSNSMASAAASARARAEARSGPRPTTVSTRPPAVR